MNRAAFSLAIPAALALCAAVAASAWVTWAPQPHLELRRPWSRTLPRPDVPPGPPGLLIRGRGTASAEIAGRWPQFLGPKRNAVAPAGVRLADSWPAGGPEVLWSVDLGQGHAGAAVANGRVYILDYDANADEGKRGDVLRCLSLADGAEIWRYGYTIPLKDDHGISRTVPAVTDRHVVTIGPACHVLCVDAVTGEYRWGMSLAGRYGTRIPEWHASQCPLIDGDKAIIATGGEKLMIAVALEPAVVGQPRVLWETPNPLPGLGDDALHITHSSIVPMTFAGTRVYVYCSTKGVVGVAETGRLLWRYPTWRPGINAVSPVILDEQRILVSADTGSLVLRLRRRPDGGVAVEEGPRTRAKVFSSYQQTPVLHEGHVYGVLSQRAGSLRGQLACLAVREGRLEPLWTSGREDRFKWGPYLMADGTMFLLHEDGELTMARATPAGYRRLARAKLLHDGDAWAPMALAGGRLLLRDRQRMLCLDVRAK